MTWASLVATLLKLALAFMSYVNTRQAMQAGQDRVIAEYALKILTQTETGKQLRLKIKALDEGEADKLWDEMTDV